MWSFPEAEEWPEITQVTQAKEGWKASHQKEEIMTGMMTERRAGEEEWEGEGGWECWGRVLWWTLTGGLRMSICLCYKSAEAAACVHWQGPDRMPLSELHEAAPGNTLSASTERLPTVRPTLLHERRRKRAIPTLAEPPPLGLDLDRHWKLSTVQKRKKYHKYAFLEINISWSHHGERRLSVFMRHLTPLHWGGWASLHVCLLLLIRR